MVCLAANKAREFIFRSLQPDKFESVQGLFYTITPDITIQEWFTRGHNNDRGASTPRPWYVSLFVTDDEYDKYFNRKVNVANHVATERGALYILIKASKRKGSHRFKFSKCYFYLSVFFYRLIANILTMWIIISLIATWQGYKKFGKLSK